VGQEIRNCIYHGSFNDLLYELNKYESWRKIFGYSNFHKRQKDIELILRFLAFYEDGESYERPIKDFISNFMAKYQNASSEKLNEFEHLFKDTCDKVLINLGEKPFHIWSGFNVAAFDSIFTVISKNSIPDNLSERYDNLKTDESFIKGVRVSTADESIVKSRMESAKKHLIG
jgi:hypothetical protein